MVAQQIEACYKVVGIPHDITCELNGSVAGDKRVSKWQNKRCFFSTPQTMLNDLESGRCNASDIVLLVFDEAHRSSGNYAYCEIIRIMIKEDAVFRVLALSATPGGDNKAVQNVCENILIQKVEIRTEESLDIRPYIFKRNVSIHVVENSDFMAEVVALCTIVLQAGFKKLMDLKALTSCDVNISGYALKMRRDAWKASRSNGRNDSVSNMIEGEYGVVIILARIFGLLVTHGITVFHTSLCTYLAGKGSAAKQRLLTNPCIAKILKLIPERMKSPGYSSHPKIEILLDILTKHFLENDKSTRCIVFSQYRESVDEIVSVLAANSLIRPTAFIGQSNTASMKGLNQKDQLKVISEFLGGTFNVMVATCIGEEGLDIGDIDLIVCFDSSASPVRMLQRMGRTGRKRSGKVSLLLSKGKEEESYRQAEGKYKNVQKAICDNGRLVLYDGRNSRIIDPAIPIECEMQLLSISDEVRPVSMKKSRSSKSSDANVAKKTKKSRKIIKLESESDAELLKSSSIESTHSKIDFKFGSSDEKSKTTKSKIMHLISDSSSEDFCQAKSNPKKSRTELIDSTRDDHFDDDLELSNIGVLCQNEEIFTIEDDDSVIMTSVLPIAQARIAPVMLEYEVLPISSKYLTMPGSPIKTENDLHMIQNCQGTDTLDPHENIVIDDYEELDFGDLQIENFDSTILHTELESIPNLAVQESAVAEEFDDLDFGDVNLEEWEAIARFADSELVNCPICNQSMASNLINVHIDANCSLSSPPIPVKSGTSLPNRSIPAGLSRRRIVEDSSSPKGYDTHIAPGSETPIIAYHRSMARVLQSTPDVSSPLALSLTMPLVALGRTPLIERIQARRGPRKSPMLRDFSPVIIRKPAQPKRERVPKAPQQIPAFFEVEAEVSSGCSVSSDEEDELFDTSMNEFVVSSQDAIDENNQTVSFYRRTLVQKSNPLAEPRQRRPIFLSQMPREQQEEEEDSSMADFIVDDDVELEGNNTCELDSFVSQANADFDEYDFHDLLDDL